MRLCIIVLPRSFLVGSGFSIVVNKPLIRLAALNYPIIPVPVAIRSRNCAPRHAALRLFRNTLSPSADFAIAGHTRSAAFIDTSYFSASKPNEHAMLQQAGRQDPGTHDEPKAQAAASGRQRRSDLASPANNKLRVEFSVRIPRCHLALSSSRVRAPRRRQSRVRGQSSLVPEEFAD